MFYLSRLFLKIKIIQRSPVKYSLTLSEMKSATVKELKSALVDKQPKELIEICLRLSKFKKENKELLTYLLYEADDEDQYIRSVKLTVDELFVNVNRKSVYFIKKSIRKILREIKKYIRYSKIKETEVELIIYFCKKLKNFTPSINRSVVLRNILQRELESVEKKVKALHEDLQYDYEMELEDLK